MNIIQKTITKILFPKLDVDRLKGKQSADIPTTKELRYRTLQITFSLLASSIDFDQMAQVVANAMDEQMDYFGGVFFIADDEHKRLIPWVYTSSPIVDQTVKWLKKPFREHEYLYTATESAAVKAFLEKKIYESNDLSEFLRPAVDVSYAKKVIRFVGIKSTIALPILLRGKALGVVLINSSREKASDEEIEMLKTFTEQIAIAIQNSKLFQQTQNQVKLLESQNRNLSLLQKTEQLVTHGLNTDVKELVQKILDDIVAALRPGLGLAWVVQGDEKTKETHIAALSNSAETVALVEKLKFDPLALASTMPQDHARKAGRAKKDKVFVYDEFEQFLTPFVGDKPGRKLIKELGLKSMAALPLVAENQKLGMLMFGLQRTTAEVTEQDRQMLESFANIVSIAFANAGNFKQIQEKNLYLSTLQRATQQIIQGGVNFKDVTQKIVDSIHDEMGYLGAFILSYEEVTNEVRLAGHSRVAIIDELMQKFHLDPGVLRGTADDSELGARVILKKEIVITDKLSDILEPTVPDMVSDVFQKTIGIKSLVSFPIMTEDKVYGMLTVALDKPKEQIGMNELEMMKALTQMDAIVLRNGQFYSEMQESNKKLQNAYTMINQQLNQLEEANKHLQQLDKAKTEFLSIASHQLRTPLSAIRGYLSMLDDGDFGALSVKQKEVMKKTQDNVVRLASLVKDLLSLARIEAGTGPKGLTLESVDMRIMIDDVVDEVLLKAAAKGLNLVWHRPEEAVMLEMDKEKIEQVVTNMIDNAVYYTLSGTIEVHLQDKGARVMFWVKDSGIGIEKEHINDLFTKFYRNANAMKVRPDGTGIGLYVAKIMVEAHHGRIFVESEINQGTTFYVELPKQQK